MGWALGAILYEINHYPWEMVASPHNSGINDDTTSGTTHYGVHSWLYLVLAAIVGEPLCPDHCMCNDVCCRLFCLGCVSLTRCDPRCVRRKSG